MLVSPSALTLGDLCGAALKESGAFGVGQTPLAEDLNDAWVRLQFMLQQWERKRWLVFHLKDYSLVSTGSQSYTFGPGGNFDTGAGASVRPEKLESAFLRQINIANLEPDYPMRIIQSREDYNEIAVKGLSSFPGAVFLDAAWPLATVYWWPIPQAGIYELHMTVKEQLPVSFATQATVFNLPYEYYAAILYNLAIRLCPKYGITPSPAIVSLAKDSLNVLRGANVAIKELNMPSELTRPGLYNIFSDRFY